MATPGASEVQQLQQQAEVAKKQISKMAERFGGLAAAHELLKTTNAQAEVLQQQKMRRRGLHSKKASSLLPMAQLVL